MTIGDTVDTVPGNIVPEAPQVIRPRTALVPLVSLPVELGIAGLGGVVAGLGTFTGTLTATTASNWTSLKAAFIGAGFTAVVFFTNSLRNWYSQRYGQAV